MATLGPARRTVGARTGGRSERVVREILEAALDELAAVGYGALRLDDVAARAHVAKTTVYRRWPTKAELVEAAIREGARFDEDLPDTGDVRSDLLELVASWVALLSTPAGRAVARLVTTEAGDPEVERLARVLRDDSRARRATLVERAKSRGELPPDVDSILVIDAIFAPIMSRLVKFGERMDRETMERVIDLVITGAEHGGGLHGRTRARRK